MGGGGGAGASGENQILGITPTQLLEELSWSLATRFPKMSATTESQPPHLQRGHIQNKWNHLCCGPDCICLFHRCEFHLSRSKEGN